MVDMMNSYFRDQVIRDCDGHSDCYPVLSLRFLYRNLVTSTNQPCFEDPVSELEIGFSGMSILY